MKNNENVSCPLSSDAAYEPWAPIPDPPSELNFTGLPVFASNDLAILPMVNVTSPTCTNVSTYRLLGNRTEKREIDVTDAVQDKRNLRRTDDPPNARGSD